MRNLKLSALYAILNLDTVTEAENLARRMYLAGLGLIQLRSKQSTEEEFFTAARRILQLRQEMFPHEKKMAAPLIIINDSVRLAKELGADGVHLGQSDESVTEARRALGEQMIIGCSTHNLEQVARAQSPSVDYLGFGPVFLSPTKSGHAPVVGIQLLSEAVRQSSLPIVAIGGVTPENAGEVFEAGATSAAVISALSQSSGTVADIERLARRFEELRTTFSSTTYQ